MGGTMAIVLAAMLSVEIRPGVGPLYPSAVEAAAGGAGPSAGASRLDTTLLTMDDLGRELPTLWENGAAPPPLPPLPPLPPSAPGDSLIRSDSRSQQQQQQKFILDGLRSKNLPTGDYRDLVSPSPSPPPPPMLSPPSPPLELIGADVGLPMKLTGNPSVDARETALISMIKVQ